MKILVVSDSHNNVNSIFNVIEKIKDKIEAVIHLGDMVSDARQIINKYPNLNVYYIKGNNDFVTNVNNEELIELGGKRIFITHGHRYNVYYGVDTLTYAGEEVKANICLYGHTHRSLITKFNGMLIMNPGSIAYPRGRTTPSYGILDISNEVVTPSIVGIYKDGYRVIPDVFLD